MIIADSVNTAVIVMISLLGLVVLYLIWLGFRGINVWCKEVKKAEGTKDHGMMVTISWIVLIGMFTPFAWASLLFYIVIGWYAGHEKRKAKKLARQIEPALQTEPVRPELTWPERPPELTYPERRRHVHPIDQDTGDWPYRGNDPA